MYRNHSVAVVLPAHNEARLLPTTIVGLPAFVDRIIVVDDGSTDDTASLVKHMADQRIDLVEHGQNYGVGRAISTGYKKALLEKMDFIVVMGADNQMCPTEIPRLLDPLVERRADYAKGNRLGAPHFGKGMPWLRRSGTRLLSYLTQYATGLSDLTDSQCGFTAITREALETVALEELFSGYGYPNDLLSQLAVRGQRIANVVVTPIYATETSGLKIHRVWLPITGILLRATIRRWRALGQAPSPLIKHPPQRDKDLAL